MLPLVGPTGSQPQAPFDFTNLATTGYGLKVTSDPVTPTGALNLLEIDCDNVDLGSGENVRALKIKSAGSTGNSINQVAIDVECRFGTGVLVNKVDDAIAGTSFRAHNNRTSADVNDAAFKSEMDPVSRTLDGGGTAFWHQDYSDYDQGSGTYTTPLFNLDFSPTVSNAGVMDMTGWSVGRIYFAPGTADTAAFDGSPILLELTAEPGDTVAVTGLKVDMKGSVTAASFAIEVAATAGAGIAFTTSDPGAGHLRGPTTAAFAMNAGTPVQTTTTTAGRDITITASPAVAGSSVDGAEMGGTITFTAGNAARRNSGNAAGGGITFNEGAGIGSGARGTISLGSSTSAVLKFFATGGATQRTSGADLTNNVTSGGTDDTIDNWTDLGTYATDAAAIRNAVYQLARKLKQINDGLRALGLFT